MTLQYSAALGNRIDRRALFNAVETKSSLDVRLMVKQGFYFQLANLTGIHWRVISEGVIDELDGV